MGKLSRRVIDKTRYPKQRVSGFYIEVLFDIYNKEYKNINIQYGVHIFTNGTIRHTQYHHLRLQNC